MNTDPVRAWQKTSPKKRAEIITSAPVLYALLVLKRLEVMADTSNYKPMREEIKLALARLHEMFGVSGVSG